MTLVVLSSTFAVVVVGVVVSQYGNAAAQGIRQGDGGDERQHCDRVVFTAKFGLVEVAMHAVSRSTSLMI